MTLTTVLLTLAASAGFAIAAPRASRALPPSVGTWLMAAGGVVAAASTATALALVGFRALAQTEPLTDRGHWSDAVLAQHDPVSAPAAVAALALLALALAAGASAVLSRARATLAGFRLAREIGGGELAVLDTPACSAFAVPGRPGRIVVTTAMLRRLEAAQRRALLAHERAHLRQHHHLFQSVTAVAAALNPLLRPLREAVALSCERWADEAAANTASRRDVADALQRTAGARPPAPAVALAAAGADVSARLAALEGPAPRLRPGRAVLLVALLAVAVVAVGVGMHSTEHLFELAQAAWRSSHPLSPR